MNTYNSASFLSVSNLKTLISIFENFLKDRYDTNASVTSLSLKEIIYETMNKIDQNKEYAKLSKTELNKITLSIVKNVVKSKFENRVIEPSRNTSQFHVVDRPAMNVQKNERELNKEFDMINKSREDIFHKPTPAQHSEKLDSAFSEQEFLQTLQDMEKMRDTQFGEVNMDSSLGSIFKNNQLSNPKELFEGTLENEHPLPQMNEILQDRTNFYIKPDKKPEKLKKYICIDSRERVDESTNPSSYVVTFDEPIKNICSATLTYVLFNPTVSTLDDLYVNLQIDEFNQDQFVSTNTQLKNSFAQLPLQGNTGVYANSLNENILREFVVPLSVLNRLTISFKKFNGELFTEIQEHFIKIEIEHYNSIGGDLDVETNLNVFQNSLQDEVFLANDETENVHEELEAPSIEISD